MADFKDVIRIKNRMHEYYMSKGFKCDDCPISYANNGTGLVCSTFIVTHPKEAEIKILIWDKLHPIKINA